jgi:mycothiol S-conjugate amidase
LVAVIRRTRPQVIVTYPRDQSGYPHPDHLRVNEISEAAFDAAGDPDRFPDAGEPWPPLRLYYVVWSAQRIRAMHAKYLELGLESPYTDERFARALEDDAAPKGTPRVVVDVSGFASTARRALVAHETQVDPTSGFWFGLPADVLDTVYPYEEYVLARDLTGAAEEHGDDLFAGIAAPAAR